MRFLRLRRLHFVGAGGVGMSGLAEILLLSTPLEISGCDLQRSENTDRLTRLGARIAYGHDPAHIRDADLLVTSSAVEKGSRPSLSSRRATRIAKHSESRPESSRTSSSESGASVLACSSATRRISDIIVNFAVIAHHL